jgi:hypothetical protein
MHKGHILKYFSTCILKQILILHFSTFHDKGRDHKADRRKLRILIFKSTLPQGRRLQCISIRPWFLTFKSTLPQGRRQQLYINFPCDSNQKLYLIYQISITKTFISSQKPLNLLNTQVRIFYTFYVRIIFALHVFIMISVIVKAETV